MEREPTVEQIVGHIMTLRCGESCDVKLNPRITRIGNLEWLLPICVQQFGTWIDIREHMEGDQVVLTITATATRTQKTTQPMVRDMPTAQPEEELTEVAAAELVAAA
jgi:cytochrome c-type biogenesis protein CcmH/NrfF